MHKNASHVNGYSCEIPNVGSGCATSCWQGLSGCELGGGAQRLLSYLPFLRSWCSRIAHSNALRAGTAGQFRGVVI